MLLLRNLVQDLKTVAADPVEEEPVVSSGPGAGRGQRQAPSTPEKLEAPLQSRGGGSKKGRKNVYDLVENLSVGNNPGSAPRTWHGGVVLTFLAVCIFVATSASKSCPRLSSRKLSVFGRRLRRRQIVAVSFAYPLQRRSCGGN